MSVNTNNIYTFSTYISVHTKLHEAMGLNYKKSWEKERFLVISFMVELFRCIRYLTSNLLV